MKSPGRLSSVGPWLNSLLFLDISILYWPRSSGKQQEGAPRQREEPARPPRATVAVEPAGYISLLPGHRLPGARAEGAAAAGGAPGPLAL